MSQSVPQPDLSKPITKQGFKLSWLCSKIPFLGSTQCVQRCFGPDQTTGKARLEIFIAEVNQALEKIEALKNEIKQDSLGQASVAPNRPDQTRPDPDVTDQGYRKLKICLDQKPSVCFEKTFEPGREYSLKAYEYNSKAQLLMFYDKKSITLLKFEQKLSDQQETEQVKYIIHEYGKLTKLPNPNTSIISARFVPNGDQIFILYTGGVGFANLNERSKQGEFEVTSKTDLPGLKQLGWMFFKTHGRILDIREFVDLFPDQIILRVACDKVGAKGVEHKTFRIDVPLYYRDPSAELESPTEIQIEGLPEENTSLPNRYMFMFEEELLLAQVTAQASEFQAAFWDFLPENHEPEADASHSHSDCHESIVSENLAEKKYNFDIDTKVLAKTVHPTNSLLLVNQANSKLAQLSIDKRSGFTLKVIIELPAKVKRVNRIWCQDKDRFILLNVNDGLLWVYAKLSDGSFGRIYDLRLPNKYSRIALTDCLEFLLTMNDRSLKAYYFQPYMKPDLNYLKLDQDPHSSSKAIGSFFLNDEIVVVIRKDRIEAQNLVIGSENFIFAEGFEYKNACDYKFSRYSSEICKGELWMFKVTFDQTIKKFKPEPKPTIASREANEPIGEHIEENLDQSFATRLASFNPYDQDIDQQTMMAGSDSSEEEEEEELDEPENLGNESAQLQEMQPDDDLNAAKALELHPEQTDIRKQILQADQLQAKLALTPNSKQEAGSLPAKLASTVGPAGSKPTEALKDKITKTYFVYLEPGATLPVIYGGNVEESSEELRVTSDYDTMVISNLETDEKNPQNKVRRLEIFQDMREKAKLKVVNLSELTKPSLELRFSKEDFKLTAICCGGRYLAVWNDIPAPIDLEGEERPEIPKHQEQTPEHPATNPPDDGRGQESKTHADLSRSNSKANRNQVEHQTRKSQVSPKLYQKEDPEEDNDSFNEHLERTKAQEDISTPQMIDIKLYDIKKLTEVNKAVACSFRCMRGVKDLVSTYDGRYILLYGDGGYQLYYNKMYRLQDETPTYKCIRRRWKESYQIINPKFVLFSDDGNYLCLAFADSCQIILLNLKNPGHIEKTKLTTNFKLKDFPMLFQFITDKTHKLVAVVDYEAKAEETRVRVYNLAQKCFVQSASFDQRLKPIFIDLRVINSELHLRVLFKDRSTANYETKETSFYQYVNNFIDPRRLPFHEALSHNLNNYHIQDSLALKKEYLEMVVDTCKAMNPDQIIDDTRVAFLIFILNKPEAFERVFSNQVDLNILFSRHNMLELVFSMEENLKEHSLSTISSMMQTCVQNKNYPVIREEFVEYLIRKDCSKLTTSPNSKAIFTNILFSPCHTKIVGLLKNKYQSMAGVGQEDSSSHSTPDYFEDKVKDLLLMNPQQTNEYEIYRTRVQLELTNGSEGSLGLMNAIFEMADDDIRYKYKQIILYKWKLVYGYSLAYCLLYYLLNILAYVYFGYNAHPAIGITIICMNALYILFEIKCLGASWRDTLKDLNKWLDLIIHGGCLCCVLAVLINFLKTLHPYFKLYAIMAVSIRGIMLLKMFGPMRVMVMLIGRIIYDLRFFPLLLAGVLVLAATVYKVAPLPGGNAYNNVNFLEALQEVFILMFMGSKADDSQVKDTSSPAGIVRSIIVVLGSTLLAQGIFNFVIAIFLQTFKRVNEDREVFELRSLILEVKDFDRFLRGFSGRMRPIKEYFYILVPVPKDGKLFENESQFDRMNSLLNGMMIEVGKKGLEKLAGQAKGVIKGKDKEINEMLDFAKANVVQTDTRAKALMGVVDGIANDGKVDLKDVAQTGLILGEVLSPGESKILKETQHLVGILKTQAGRLSNNEELELDQVLELGLAVCQQVYPDSKKYITKLNALKTAAVEIANSVKALDTGKAEAVSNIIKAAGTATSAVINEKLGKKVGRMAKLVEVMIRQGHRAKKEESVEVGKLAAELAGALSDIGVDFLPPKVVTLLKKLDSLSTRLESVSTGSKLDTVKAIELIAEVLMEITDDENLKKLLKVLIKLVKSGDKLSEEYGLKNKLEIATLADCAADLTDEFDSRLRGQIEKLKDMALAVQQSVEDLKSGKSFKVAPLARICIKLLPTAPPNAEKVVNAIEATVALIENSAEALKETSRVGVSATVQSAVDLVLILTDGSLGETLTAGIQNTVRAVELVQNQVDSLRDNSADPVSLCDCAAELVCLFAPQFADPAAKTSKAVRLLNKQVANLKAGLSLDVESLLDDVGELAVIANEELEPTIRRFLPIAKLVAGQAQDPGSWQLQDRKASEVIGSVEAMVTGIFPSSERFLQAAKSIARLAENFDSLQHVNLGETVEAIGNLAITFDPSIEPRISKAVSLAAALQQTLLLMENAQQADVGLLFRSIGDALTAAFPELSKAVPFATDCAIAIRAAVQIKRKSEGASPAELLRKVGALIVSLNRSYEANVSFVLEVVDMVELQIRGFKDGKKVKVNEIASIAGKIILKVDPDYSKPVQQVSDMIKLVEELVAGEQQISAAQLHSVVEKIGYYICVSRPEFSPNVKKVVNIFKVVSQQSAAWLVKKENFSVESALQAASSIALEVNSDLSEMVDRVRRIVELVVLRARALRDQQGTDIGEAINATVGLIAMFNPQLAEQAKTASRFAAAVAAALVQIKSASEQPSLDSLLQPCAELVLLFQPDLKPPVQRVVRTARALSDLARSGSSDISSLRIGGFVARLGQIDDLFDPKTAKYLQCAAAVIQALEEQVLPMEERSRQASACNLIRSLVDTLSLVNPKIQEKAGFFVGVSECLREQLEALNTGEPVRLSAVIGACKQVFAALKLADCSEYLVRTQKVIEFIEKTAAGFASQSCFEVSDMLEHAKPLLLEISPALQPHLELIEAFLVVTEQQAHAMLKGKVDLTKMMESAALILDKAKPELSPFVRSVAGFAALVERKHKEAKGAPDSAGRFLAATITAAEIVAELKPECREQIEAVTGVLALVDQSLQVSANFRQLDLAEVIKGCSRVLAKTQPQLSGDLSKATSMLLLIEESFRNIVENQRSPQVVLASLQRIASLLDESTGEKVCKVLNPVCLSLALVQGSPATFDGLGEAWQALSKVVSVEDFTPSNIESVLQTLRILVSKAKELGGLRSTEFRIIDAANTTYVVRTNADGSIGSLTIEQPDPAGYE